MQIFTTLRKHVVAATALTLVVVVIAIIAGRAATRPATVSSVPSLTQVSLVGVSTFRQGNTSISANGIVEANSQADLKSQISAAVSTIDVSIGDTVHSGQALVELANSDIKAQLAQSQAALASAQGQYQTGAVSLSSAEQAAINEILDAYIKTYDAVVTQADPILYNTDGTGRQLTSFSTDGALNSELIGADLDLRNEFPTWKAIDDQLSLATSTDVIQSTIALAQKNANTANLLLNDMSKVLNGLSNGALPSFIVTLNGWKATVSGAHDTVSGVVQALSGATTAMNTAITSQDSTANAQVEAAQAGVANLQAQLAKTIITSPIDGKVSALPLHEGELASPGTLLATVIGNGNGLKIKAYVSGEDLSNVEVGAAASIEGQLNGLGSSTENNINGVVSNVAPGVDATTKEAEVDININNSANSGLVIGNNVSVNIMSASTSASSVYMVPIQDVKIVPGAAYVLTVGSDSKIVFNPVTIGNIDGDFIQITGGLNDSMNIVSPVYELQQGQSVTVQ